MLFTPLLLATILFAHAPRPFQIRYLIARRCSLQRANPARCQTSANPFIATRMTIRSAGVAPASRPACPSVVG